MAKLRVRVCGFPRETKLGNFYPLLSKFDNQICFSSPFDADVLFVTHHPRSFRELFSIPDKGQIRIFIGLEAQSPDMNIFDYGISFDSTISGERNFRPHTLITFENFLRYGSLDPVGTLSSRALRTRTLFCDFIYGNRGSNPTRDSIFHYLNSRVGTVSSYGTHLRNAHFSAIGITTRASDHDWKWEKIEAQKRHQFSIAAENARFVGYSTEKLLTPLIAGSIPIYWGNPEVIQEFNPDRFLYFDGEDYGRLESEVLSLISDPELMESKARQPALTEQQLELLEMNRSDMVDWFGRFLLDDLKALQKRPSGWFPDWYENMVSSGYFRQKFSIARLHGAWRSISGRARS